MIDPTPILASMLPARLAGYAPLIVLSVVVLCKLITVIRPPPAPTSRWLPLYTLISRIGLNVGWAVNAFQSGKSPILVPCDRSSEIRTAVANTYAIEREETKP